MKVFHKADDEEFEFNPTDTQLKQMKEDGIESEDFWMHRSIDNQPVRRNLKDLTLANGSPFKTYLTNLLQTL